MTKVTNCIRRPFTMLFAVVPVNQLSGVSATVWCEAQARRKFTLAQRACAHALPLVGVPPRAPLRAAPLEGNTGRQRIERRAAAVLACSERVTDPDHVLRILSNGERKLSLCCYERR